MKEYIVIEEHLTRLFFRVEAESKEQAIEVARECNWDQAYDETTAYIEAEAFEQNEWEKTTCKQ